MGSTFATISWDSMSIIFSTCLDRLANSTDTDRALTAPIGLLLWAVVSMIDMTLGDEITGLQDIRHQWIPQSGRQS
jgi:uncharacterized BrkB/YihY/UPF0761 family membrane protein